VDLKAMNKKFAFIAGRNEPRKMDLKMPNRFSSVMIVKDNL